MQREILERCNRWRKEPDMPEELRVSLDEMQKNADEMEDCFYRELAFGTGGLRGILGAGTNRMNIYTVGKATQGLAEYLKRTVCRQIYVAIAYDSRLKSEDFAKYAAEVLAANGIIAWVYPRLEPTPALSWAVRNLHCNAGICITASHNPAQYNGYKVYGADGCQITLEAAQEIQKEINRVDLFRDVKRISFEDGLEQGFIRMVPESVLNEYIEAICGQIPPVTGNVPLKIVYTPLNGSGRECVLRALERTGMAEITVVPEQEWPDGNFSTCPSPNPELCEALERGLELCSRIRPDLLIATDPDCDRIGIAVVDGAHYVRMTGNEVGILLLDYLCKLESKKNSFGKKPVAITTIVSTDMADAVCRKYGAELRRTLTGFKFIGEQIGILEREGEADRFLFGFEESCGYLSGTHVRDKDAVNAAVLICSMAMYYKKNGITLWQVMNGLYEEFGWYQNKLLSFYFSGPAGMETMQKIMRQIRVLPPKEIGGLRVLGQIDYQKGVQTLPKGDVLELRLEKDAKLMIRPSGTEPKIKVYIFVHQSSEKDASDLLEKLSEAVYEEWNLSC